MKIAFLTTDNRGQFKEYSKPEPFFGPAPEALLQGLAATPGIEVHIVSCIRQPVRSPEKLAENTWFHSLLVPKIGWMRTFYQGCIRATRRKVQEIRPDIVHGQGTELDCSISAIYCGFPNLVTIHGNMRLIARLNREKPFSFNWLAARLEAFTLPRSDGVLCITNYTREAVADLARRTWVVPNAVDAGFFEVRPDLQHKPPTGLCVGNVCFRKNQNNFIRALDPLAKERDFKMVFLGSTSGDSPYRAEFTRLVQDRPWCEYGGFAGRSELKDYLKRAAFLVLPSLEDNCPMVVLEAMAAGVPVIAPRVGGVPDLVRDGINGLLCDPLDAGSMRGKVEQLLKDPGFARRLADAARCDALARFHPRVIARQHVEIYRELLAAK